MLFDLLLKWRKCLESPASISERSERRNLGEVFQSIPVLVKLECLFLYCSGCSLKVFGVCWECDWTFFSSKVFHQSKLELFLSCLVRGFIFYMEICIKCCKVGITFPMRQCYRMYVYGDRRKWKVCVTIGRHFVLVASRSCLFSILSALKFFLCSL